MHLWLQRSVEPTMSGRGLPAFAGAATEYIINAIPDLYDQIEGVIFDDLPAVNNMMEAANCSIKFANEAKGISNDVAMDLNSLSLNYTENFAILKKFRYNYTKIFQIMSEKAETAFDHLEVKPECFDTMKELMRENARTGKMVVAEV